MRRVSYDRKIFKVAFQLFSREVRVKVYRREWLERILSKGKGKVYTYNSPTACPGQKR